MERASRELHVAKEEASKAYFEIKRDTILKVSARVMDRLEEVYASYSSLAKIDIDLDSILSLFFPIKATWILKGWQLKEVLLPASQRKGSEAKEIEVTWKNYNTLIKELLVIEKEKQSMNDRFESFKGL